MKKLTTLLAATALLFACQNKKEQPKPTTLGDFTFSSKNIIASTPFTITYNGSGNLEDGFYHNIISTKNLPYDIIFTNKQAVITVPDSIANVVFYFKIDGVQNTNKGTGYVFNVVDKNGTMKPDTEASKQFYLLREGAYNNLKGGDASLTLNAIETALKQNPDLTKKWYNAHLQMAKEVDNKKAKAITNKYIASTLAKTNLNLEDYEKLATLYTNLKDNIKKDSINNLISKNYPKSDAAINVLTSSFFDLSSTEEKEAFFNKHKTHLQGSKNEKYFLQSLARDYYKKGDLNAFQSYFDQLKNNTAKASLINSLVWPKAEKGEDLEEASKLSKLSLEFIAKEQETLAEKPEYYSTNQYKESLKNSYSMYADTYAMLLFKNGNIKDAIKYQEKAVDKGYSPDVNTRYIEYLIVDKAYTKAIEKAKDFIANGASTAKLKDDFKTAFIKANPDTDISPLLADLETKAKAKQLEDLKKTMLNETAPNFTIKNLNGDDVSLEALKGKTVILDFWATWCGPCIKSFPGMQNAVTKYKDNNDVVFLFVDTFENGKNRETSVAKFIEDNNYDFHVLIDPKQENANKYEVANKYNISGIPTKVIIGPDGRIKFKDVGFSGSNDKLVDKIDGMISLINP